MDEQEKGLAQDEPTGQSAADGQIDSEPAAEASADAAENPAKEAQSLTEEAQNEQMPAELPEASAAPADNITIPIRARKEKKRRRWLWILIPAILLLLGAGAFFGYYFFLRVPMAEQVIMKDNQTAIREGDTYPIRYSLYPSGADQTLSWSSTNPKVATVDDTGTVTALTAGSATITATAKSGATGFCYVTVRPPITDEESELLGTWSLFVVSEQGHIDYYYGSAYSMTFYSDKTGILTENGEETNITWEFDEIIDGYNYYDVKIPGHRGATLKLNSNTGDGMSGSLTLGLSDTLLWVFMKKK